MAQPSLPAVDQVRSPRALLDVLVSFPTVSRDSNLELVDWIAAWLSYRGIDSGRDYNSDGTKASLYAHVGPMVAGGVLLSGHTDVVPVDGQAWTSDPFIVTERDGKLYGRGTTDMKGFDALALWAMAEAAQQGVSLPLQIALSRDEEIGCLGAAPMLARMAAQGLPQAEVAIIGEPTQMACVTGHKGGFGYWIEARGFEVHSSILHTGVSAIMEAARVIDWANRQNAAGAAATPSEVAAQFDPPWTTVHSGMIAGGTAHNITAARCGFGIDFRLVPDESVEQWRDKLFDVLSQIEAEMVARSTEAGFSPEERFVVPGLLPERDGAAEMLVRKLTGDNSSHVVSYGTDAGHFQAAGYSTVVCGPGNIAQAHQPEEFITLDQFQRGQDFMRKLVASL